MSNIIRLTAEDTEELLGVFDAEVRRRGFKIAA